MDILDRLDPEAAALIREIAANPRSTLLSASGMPDFTRLPADQVVVTPRTPRLQLAERELLRVHRYEVGTLLHDLAQRQILDESAKIGLTVSYVRPMGTNESASKTRMSQILSDTDDKIARAGLDLGLKSSLLELQALPALRTLNLAHRLRPSPATTLNASVVWISNGASAYALNSLQALNPERLRNHQHIMLVSNIALALSVKKDFGASAANYADAVKQSGMLSHAIASVLLFVFVQDTRGVDWALKQPGIAGLSEASRAGVARPWMSDMVSRHSDFCVVSLMKKSMGCLPLRLRDEVRELMGWSG